MFIKKGLYRKILFKTTVYAVLTPILFHMHHVYPSPYNGFDLTQSLVPQSEIYSGGPSKDGIPALLDPEFQAGLNADWLDNEDRVLGIFMHGVAKAYPLRILNWHEIVNDKIGDEYFVITYCPLCYSGMAFHATFHGIRLKFGVSGLLYNSDVLLYDKQTESLWSQIMAKGITGHFINTILKQLVVTNTTWGDWKNKHPQTLVLSLNTGYTRQYSRDPYLDYRQSESLYFPVKFRAEGYHPKEPVLGINIKGSSKAYPLSELSRSPVPFTDLIAGQEVLVYFDRDNKSGIILDKNCRQIPTTIMYWFAWYTFHPETDVYKFNHLKANENALVACQN